MFGSRERGYRVLTVSATVLGVIAIALVVVNFYLVLQNQRAQAEVNQRQQFIAQSAQLSSLNEALIRSIATAAASNNDDKLRDVLNQNGITYTVNPAGNPAGNPAAPANGARR
jgi:hypothetical protein